MEWSKGVIFLMATFWPEGLCIAELGGGRVSDQRSFFKVTRASDSPDNSIGALADDILNVVLLAHIEGDLAGASRVGRLSSRHSERALASRNGKVKARKSEVEGCSAFKSTDQLLQPPGRGRVSKGTR